jgi:hypothetical protein
MQPAMISVADFLGVVASLVTIAAAIAIFVRYVFPRSTDKNRFRVVALTSLALIVVVVLAFVVASSAANQLGAAGSVIAIQTQGSTSSTSASTATPRLVPTATTAALLGDGTVVVNQEVTCANCDATYKVVLQTALIDTNLEHTQITFAVTNRTGSASFLHFSILKLTDARNHSFTGSGDQDIFGFGAGATKDLLETFPLVPHAGDAYTLSLAIATNANYVDPLQYDPLNFIF